MSNPNSGSELPREGLVRTVLGDVPPDALGMTLAHEHLVCNASAWHVESDDPIAAQEPCMGNQWWFRAHPDSNAGVLGLDDEEAAGEELEVFAALGGGALVELSCTGLHGDPVAVARISKRTGIHVIAGCGYYVDLTHPPVVAQASVDELAQTMVDSIESGIDGTNIRAGVIGEIGMSWPLTEGEEKVLRAAARAQRRTGAAISVHTAIHAPESHSALVAADILSDEGADLTRVIMGHLDATLPMHEHHLAVAERGCLIAFDTFGCEFFESEADFVWSSDQVRTRAVAALVAEGLEHRLLLSQDVYIRIQWQRYGGCGYGHILRNIVPRLRLEGVRDDQIESMLISNPARVLPLAQQQP